MTSFVMKLFPLLLVGAILTPGAALAGNNNNGNGCRNRCGDTQVTNNGDRVVNNTTNNNASASAQGGAGGQGGQGGQGGAESNDSSFTDPPYKEGLFVL